MATSGISIERLLRMALAIGLALLGTLVFGVYPALLYDAAIASAAALR